MEKIVPALFCIVFIGMIAAFALSENRPPVPESTPCGTADCPALNASLQETPTPVPEKTQKPSPAPTQMEKTILEIKITGFSTDKNVYSSNQQLKAAIILNSSRAASGITARLHGINAGGRDRIDETKTIDLAEGENLVEFSAATPYCTSGCGGVFPGQYELLFEVLKEGELPAQASATIELVKG